MDNSVVWTIQFKTQLSIWQNTLNPQQVVKLLYLTHASLRKENGDEKLKVTLLLMLIYPKYHEMQ